MFGFYHEWRHHLRCIITVPYGGTIRMVKVKWMNQSKDTFDDTVGKDKHTYNIRLEDAIMSNKNNPILWYKRGDTEPIKINSNDSKGKSSKLYHTTLKSKVAEDVLNENKNKTMFLIIGLFVIVIIGIGLYSQYMLSEQNDKILLLTKRLTEALVNNTKTGGVVIR
jgi:hypothetical protein